MPFADKLSAESAYLAHQYLAQPTLITTSGSSNTSAALANGIYSLVATAACYFRQGNSVVAATSSDHYVPAGQVRYLAVTASNTDDYVAAIQLSTAGVVQLHPIGAKTF